MAVAGVIAAIVFGIGQHLFPIKRHQIQPLPPPPPPPVAAPPPAVAPPIADAATPEEAGTVATKIADAAAAAPEKKTEEAAAEGSGATAPAERKPIDKQRSADRELAREAWRHNRPDISVIGTKTSVMVPIRGSIKGADFKILKKSRTVAVTLPKAVSMITLRVYNLKHPSFKTLWIDQDEANAQPADGTKLRLILSQTYDPQVEITEDFVRITIRRPASAAADDAPAEKHSGSRAEKHERAEKSAEKSTEPAPAEEAPAPEKTGD